jgi:alpha-galactosidase
MLIGTLLSVITIGQGATKIDDLPLAPAKDAVMAKPFEIQQMRGWAQNAFGNRTKDELRITVLRQDYSVLRFGRSTIDTPLKIGKKSFKYGLGSHANSDLLVKLPEEAKAFDAVVGIDNNPNTLGKRGSVVFSIEINGQEVFKSPVIKGSDEGVPVHVDIPKGVKSLNLKMDTTADGPAHDQGDWGDARVTLTNGSQLRFDDAPVSYVLNDRDVPFSFNYGGAPANLNQWSRLSTIHNTKGQQVYFTTWTSPDNLLKVEVQAKTYTDFSAVDWVVNFENIGKTDTPIIDNIQAVDTPLNLGGIDLKQTLHRLKGDQAGIYNYQPIDVEILNNTPVAFAPARGRPSQETAFPYFDIENGFEGVFGAIGWSGQWAANIGRTGIQAGMEKTHLLLHPGERIRSPRIVLMSWTGNREDAINRWRRLMLFHYTPKIKERPIQLPVSMQCFDRYWIADPLWATEKGQIESARSAAKVGCDTHWFDAAWFVGNFPNGVGNWFCKPKEFPRGLAPIGDECHKLGVNFMLWFEPERVGAQTQVATEHPEWVFGGVNGGLYRMDLPEARKWMTDKLVSLIKEFKLDIYREDFNIDPLGYWRNNDTPDRIGMTEIRFTEGFYAMWDELLAKNPGLRIDNCASGGRRIDIETMSRSMPLWRSDFGCGPGNEGYAQTQTSWLNRYIPLHATCSWMPEAYSIRSTATAGLAAELDIRSKDFPLKLAQQSIGEIRENSKYWYGDFYTLTPISLDSDQFIAYQLHRADLDSGIILAFRREKSSTIGLILAPKAIKPNLKYTVEIVDESFKKTTYTTTGKDMLDNGVSLRIGKPRSSLMVRYRAVK